MSLFFRFRYNLEVSDVQGSDFIMLNFSGIEISEETIWILLRSNSSQMSTFKF